MTITRSILLFALAALFEIGGAWLVWQGCREQRGLWWIAAGVIALGLYGFGATYQPDPHFGRILATYGSVFVAGSLAGASLSTSSARSLRHHRCHHLPHQRRRHHVRPHDLEGHSGVR
jgi:small multidrug resistance family-3 protein